MDANQALNNLKRGQSVTRMTPSGVEFRIESKLSHGLAWYRAFPARKGCLNRFSRLSDTDMLQWLGNVTVKEH